MADTSQHVNIEETLSTRPETMTGLAVKYFFRHKLAVTGLIIVVLLVIACIVGPNISPYDVEKSSLRIRYQPPSLEHPFGTDDLGRDMLTRILFGGRISLSIGLFSMLLAVIVGVTIGSLAGFFGGALDNILMRFTDLMLTIPRLFLLIIMAVILRGIDWPYMQEAGGIMAIILVIGILSWMSIARLVRGAFLSLREKEFVEAARSLGLSNFRIIVATYPAKRDQSSYRRCNLRSCWGNHFRIRPELPGIWRPAPHPNLGQYAANRPGRNAPRPYVDGNFSGSDDFHYCAFDQLYGRWFAGCP